MNDHAIDATSEMEALIERCLEAAVRAPSIHNTQPWRFAVSGRHVYVYADRTRQLAVLDPQGRQLAISVGAALMNLRAAMAEHGVHVDVSLSGAVEDEGRLARLSLTDLPLTPDDRQLGSLASAIPLRRTNRRRFSDDAVPEIVLDALRQDASSEQTTLHVVASQSERLALARATQRALDLESADPMYRAELRRWTTIDPTRPDGISQLVIPYNNGNPTDEVPIRDFDTFGMGWLPSHPNSNSQQCFVVVLSHGDDLTNWIMAGQALERVLLRAQSHGFTNSIFTAPIEVADTRLALQHALDTALFPQVLVRLGRAPATPATNRRSVAQVLISTS